MMENPTDYLTAAVAYQHCLVNSENFKFPRNRNELNSSFQDFYERHLPDQISDLVFRKLAKLGLLQLREDKYAGLIILIDQDHFDSQYLLLCDDESSVFVRPMHEAFQFYKNAMASKQFWIDLEEEISKISPQLADEGITNQVPASDRYVTLTHNSPESREIDGAIEITISNLKESNSIAEKAGADRDRLIAEGTASRSLIRGEVISWEKLRSLVLGFLKEILRKFKDEATSWGVSKAIAVLSKLLGS